MGWLNWNAILPILKQYGPVVTILGGIVIWMARRIDFLLDRNAAIYKEEIHRMSAVQDRLLNRLLGDQQSSSSAPDVQQLRAAVASQGNGSTNQSMESGTGETK